MGSSTALFGAFQLAVGQRLGFPALLLPSLNSVGAEVGKPVAPQTTSVGVATTSYVRNGEHEEHEDARRDIGLESPNTL